VCDVTARPRYRTYIEGVASLRLRDIRSNDKIALVRFHEHLSHDTRYRRYHAAEGELTTSDLRYLTEVDGPHHVALVAEVSPPSSPASRARRPTG